jgi:chromosome segregation ATPase
VGGFVKSRKKDFNAVEFMLKERENLLKHHEEKVIHFKEEFEKKLAAISEKEKSLNLKEHELKGLEKSTRGLVKKKRELEIKCGMLSHEEAVFKDYIEHSKNEVEKLHTHDAKKRWEIATFQKKLEEMKKDFETLFSNTGRVTLALKAKEAELKRVTKDLTDAEQRHSKLVSHMGHHSTTEILKCIGHAFGHVKHHRMENAFEEYEHIRNLYSLLSKDDKRKMYGQIEKIRLELSKLKK